MIKNMDLQLVYDGQKQQQQKHHCRPRIHIILIIAIKYLTVYVKGLSEYFMQTCDDNNPDWRRRRRQTVPTTANTYIFSLTKKNNTRQRTFQMHTYLPTCEWWR